VEGGEIIMRDNAARPGARSVEQLPSAPKTDRMYDKLINKLEWSS